MFLSVCVPFIRRLSLRAVFLPFFALLVLASCSSTPKHTKPEVHPEFDLRHTHIPNPKNPGQPWILVGGTTQVLRLFDAQGNEQLRYTISTAKNGFGQATDSFQTPVGWHKICRKIGDFAPQKSVFVARERNGRVLDDALKAEYPNRDWVLTRIMWLCGQEPGLNQGGNVDSFNRFIYIHGAADDVPFGTPTSLGCIRMRNNEVIQLYNRIDTGIDLLISEAD